MRRVAFAAFALLCVRESAYAQEPSPYPRVVVDLHGIVPVFPNDNEQLADSRFVTGRTPPQLQVGELPGAGFGGRVGVHVYLFKWSAVTFGVGGEVLAGHSSSTPPEGSSGLVAVSERLSSADGQVSLNFGTGHGWSYLSGGVGRTQWSIVPAGQSPMAPDIESLPTTNYGGGAHWSIKRHLGFSLDVRVYEIQPGSTGSPRTRLLVIGAGVFLK
ncbi:MAG TPA: hypothetical protein VLV86_09905 [Vicinamibacterales bacterium]|nr:hypothetical protein [Vicinamibacterales bacterium]